MFVINKNNTTVDFMIATSYPRPPRDLHFEWRLLELCMVDTEIQKVRLESSSVDRLLLPAKMVETSKSGGPAFSYESLPPLKAISITVSASDLMKAVQLAGRRPSLVRG